VAVSMGNNVGASGHLLSSIQSCSKEAACRLWYPTSVDALGKLLPVYQDDPT